ncbi:MAG: GntR family transcriptional regulator [Chloroflexota bacterium]|nr:MAG: GntR family transcriptional regulator [Chloroflexota bacterium]
MDATRIYEQIVTKIEQQILSGELTPGDKLPSERELTKEFGVSRVAVREAVKTLREKGLVDIQLGRGTFVTNQTASAMRRSFNALIKFGYTDAFYDLTEIREILEPEIAAQAALNITPEQLSALRQTIEILDDHRYNVEAWAQADSEFHGILAEAMGNRIIPILLNSVTALIHDQRRRLIQLPDRGRITREEHQRILDAVAAQDPQAARAAMLDHLRRVRDDCPLITAEPSVEDEGNTNR